MPEQPFKEEDVVLRCIDCDGSIIVVTNKPDTTGNSFTKYNGLPYGIGWKTIEVRDIVLDEAIRQLADAQEQVKQLQRERDLALAHDTQSYPTVHAYEMVCKALEKTKEQLAAKDEQIAEQARAITIHADRANDLNKQVTKLTIERAVLNENCRVKDDNIRQLEFDLFLLRVYRRSPQTTGPCRRAEGRDQREGYQNPRAGG